MKFNLLLMIIALGCLNVDAQSVGINTDHLAPDSSAMLDVRNPNKGFLLPRVALTGTNDSITIHKPAVALMVYNTSTTTGITAVFPGFYYYNGTAWLRTTGSLSLPAYAIGQSLYGGIIFWLDSTQQHGLIVSPGDVGGNVSWSNGSYINTQAVRSGIYGGYYNTSRIIADQKMGSYASQAASQFEGGSFGDWYLPSRGELMLLYQQRASLTGFSGIYWSSTEQVTSYWNIADMAWTLSATDGSTVATVKNTPLKVRAIRSF